MKTPMHRGAGPALALALTLALTGLATGPAASAKPTAVPTTVATAAAAAAPVKNAPPVARLALDPSTGPAPHRVTADGSGSTDDVAVQSYSFSWGDGTTSTGPQPEGTATHAYSAPGSYTVTLTVDDGAKRGTASQVVTVTAPDPTPAPDAPPTAAVTARPATGNAPLATEIDATASSDDRGIAGYAFDFGDGSETVQQPAAVVSHSYVTAGEHTVTMTVTDTAGQTATATTKVVVTTAPPPPAPAPLAPTTVSLTFDDSLAEQAPAVEMLQQRGLRSTLYVNSPRIGTAGYLSKAQLDAIVAGGGEVAGHTLTHADLAASSLGDAKRQVCNDRVNLLDMGYRVTSFAYPFGSTSAAVKQVVQECGYNSARGVADLLSPGYGCDGCATAETIPPADVWKIRTPQSVQSDTTLEMLKNYVTQAESSSGGWVPLIFHHVCEGCATNAVDTATLTAFADWLQQRPASTQVRTVDEVVGGTLKPGVTYVPTTDEVSGVTVGTATRVVDGTNSYRGTNMLVYYTPARGATTGTNVFGTEVAVVGGKVTKVEVSVGNMAIPRDGYVLSGHGTSNTWLRTYAKVGAPVTLRYGSP
ncbi:PKD domain-containing protein [Nocardioides aurantiacus]|uniref:PKD domain-containing protein n=1 Tax=Nocardioides aurantiacus TaxID=86796 RepID=UPI00403FADCD